MNEIMAMAVAQVRSHGEAISTGMQAERNYTHPYLYAIFAAYDLAKADAAAKLPTALHAAIENARRALGECAPVASPYAERRSQQRSDLELSVDGRQIRPGQ